MSKQVTDCYKVRFGGSSASEPCATRICAASTWARTCATSTPRCSGAYDASRRVAFSSWLAVATGRPRPAWYQATATWTSPWKKSRSSGAAARQASSSSSCASKYRPARISSRPRSNADADLSVLDPDVVRLELDCEVELVLARADVVLPAVPGAGEDAALEPPLPERPLEVDAVRLDRVEAAVAVGERKLHVAGVDGPNRAC